MSDNTRSVDEAVARIRERLTQRYRMPQGLLITVATGRDEGQEKFFTGKAVFSDALIEPRRRLDYAGLSLLEEWVSPIDLAMERIDAMFRGNAIVAGKTFATEFHHWSPNPWGESFRHSGWLEWVMEAKPSYTGRQAGPSSKPVVGFGMPPFSSGPHALSEWVWGANQRDSGNQRLGELLIILPDTRGRILEAGRVDE